MSGRKPSPCWEHVRVTALLPDGRQRRECGFCGAKRESKQDQASAWAKHLCIDCPGADDEFKARVYQRHKTAEIERLFVRPARGKFAEEEVVVLDEGDDEGDEGSSQEGLGP